MSQHPERCWPSPRLVRVVARRPTKSISEREMDIVCEIAKGQTNKEIGSCLGISDQTVKNYVTTLLVKFGVADRTGLVISALVLGYITLANTTPDELVSKDWDVP